MENDKNGREDRKRAVSERDALDLERFIKDLKKFLPTPLCSVTPLHIVLDINNSFEDFSGYNELEIVGESVETLFPESEHEKLAALKDRVLETDETVRGELSLKKQDGEVVPVSVTLMRRKDSEEDLIVGYFLAISDLSVLKKQQEELHEKIKQLEIFKALAVGREEKMVRLKEENRLLKEKLKE